MATIGDFDPLNSIVPATKIEVTVSCRSEAAGFSYCIGEREKPRCSSFFLFATQQPEVRGAAFQLIFSRKPPFKSSFSQPPSSESMSCRILLDMLSVQGSLPCTLQSATGSLQ
ncbi:unnamed protein product [Pleuronectes platessa]|uniref:Uncharacterized protein n=1 Tax=Pleuronectes platessa TaxID=8262 RepID=A0A9N7ZDE0_PLEPL|nr:unnamed protein product [Pleuronectes platessa]